MDNRVLTIWVRAWVCHQRSVCVTQCRCSLAIYTEYRLLFARRRLQMPSDMLLGLERRQRCGFGRRGRRRPESSNGRIDSRSSRRESRRHLLRPTVVSEVFTERGLRETYHRELEEGHELEEMTDGNTVLIPCRDVVAKPVSDITAGTDESAACYY